MSLAAFLACPTAGEASAILAPPPMPGAAGDITAIYIYSDAGDTSMISDVMPGGNEQMFCDKVHGSCAAGAPGQTINLGVQDGPLVFRLDDMSSGTTLFSDAPDASGDYHARVTQNYGDFGVGPLPAAVSTILIAEAATGAHFAYVGWEDETAAQGADFDYNDVIFALVMPRPVRVPEPLPIALVGAGLIGIAALRRNRGKRT